MSGFFFTEALLKNSLSFFSYLGSDEGDGHLPFGAGNGRAVGIELFLRESESGLAVSVLGLLDLHHRESHLACPGAHDLPDGFLGGLLQTPPEVLRLRVLVGVLLEIGVHALAEGVVADVVVQHSDYGSTLYDGNEKRGAGTSFIHTMKTLCHYLSSYFVVGNAVKDFVNFVRVADLDFNGMRVFHGVQFKGGD